MKGLRAMRINSTIGSFAKIARVLFLVLAAPGAFGQDNTGHKGHDSPLPSKVAPEASGAPSAPAGKAAAKPEKTEPAPPTITLSQDKVQLIGVRTAPAVSRSLAKQIRTVGKVDVDETRLAYVNTKISGWVTKLYVDYTGKQVVKGEPLLLIYSPDLVSAQEEYLLALRTRSSMAMPPELKEVEASQDTLLESSRRRLLLWDITPGQIEELEKTGKPRTEMTILAPIDGIVLEKMVIDGAYITSGMNLYKIADLSRVWILADVYEYEVPLVRQGQQARIDLPYLAGRRLTATVSFVHPTLDPVTRTVRVRLEVENPGLMIKPEMFVNVEIAVSAGMRLSIPIEAVIDSGTRKIVYVEKKPGVYEMREVTLGSRGEQYVEVLRGIRKNERVVTSGNFLIDSESQLRFGTGGGHQH
jgi:membrane fusion protein, copper/silver efflux system